jgi:hypothetical protein
MASVLHVLPGGLTKWYGVWKMGFSVESAAVAGLSN